MPESHFKAEIMWPILVANKVLRRPFFSNSFVADFPAIADLHDRRSCPEEPIGSKLLLPVETESVKYRLFASTWNVGGIPPDDELNLEEFLDTKNNCYDIYVTGFQEVVPLSAKSVLGWEKKKMFAKWNLIIRRTLNKRLGSFRCIVSKQMVGIMVSVWVRDDILPFIHHPSVSCVGCGVLGCLGNKGSVSVRFSLHETSLCIVCCHLASGAREEDEMLRNSNASEIISRTIFPSGPSLHLPTKMNDHDFAIPPGLTIAKTSKLMLSTSINNLSMHKLDVDVEVISDDICRRGVDTHGVRLSGKSGNFGPEAAREGWRRDGAQSL